jgi:hypothetical protein
MVEPRTGNDLTLKPFSIRVYNHNLVVMPVVMTVMVVFDHGSVVLPDDNIIGTDHRHQYQKGCEN